MLLFYSIAIISIVPVLLADDNDDNVHNRTYAIPLRDPSLPSNSDLKATLLNNLNHFFDNGEKLEELAAMPGMRHFLISNSVIHGNKSKFADEKARNTSKRKLVSLADHHTTKIIAIGSEKNITGPSSALKRSYGKSTATREGDPVRVIHRRGKTIRLFGLDNGNHNKTKGYGGGSNGGKSGQQQKILNRPSNRQNDHKSNQTRVYRSKLLTNSRPEMLRSSNYRLPLPIENPGNSRLPLPIENPGNSRLPLPVENSGNSRLPLPIENPGNYRLPLPIEDRDPFELPADETKTIVLTVERPSTFPAHQIMIDEVGHDQSNRNESFQSLPSINDLTNEIVLAPFERLEVVTVKEPLQKAPDLPPLPPAPPLVPLEILPVPLPALPPPIDPPSSLTTWEQAMLPDNQQELKHIPLLSQFANGLASVLGSKPEKNDPLKFVDGLASVLGSKPEKNDPLNEALNLDVDQIESSEAEQREQKDKCFPPGFECTSDDPSLMIGISPPTIPDDRCNSLRLRYFVLTNIVAGDADASKRAIQTHAEHASGKFYNVICGIGTGLFSYVVHTDEFCQAQALAVTCYIFSPICQPRQRRTLNKKKMIIPESLNESDNDLLKS